MNRRDRDLLVILVSLIIGALIYFFLIRPAYEQRQNLLQQRQDAMSSRDRVILVLQNLPVLQQTEPQMRVETNDKYESFFYDLKTERILNHLDSLITKTRVLVTSYVPSGPAVSGITIPASSSVAVSYPLLDIAATENTSLSSGVSPGNESAVPSVAIPRLDITLGIGASTFESIMSFIEELERMNKALVINNVILNRSETRLEGQIMISLYSLPKLDTTQESEYVFSPSIPTGKSNTFS